MWCTYVAVALALVAAADAYSTGAPSSTCRDMTPKHPVPAQTRPAPYTITTSTQSVKAGSSLEVTIAGKSPSDKIRGLLLQARQGDNIVGGFTIDSDDSFAQLLNCGTPNNAITHKRHEENQDQNSVTYKWKASADLKGEIKFKATIAVNGAVFWVGVESAPVQVV